MRVLAGLAVLAAFCALAVWAWAVYESRSTDAQLARPSAEEREEARVLAAALAFGIGPTSVQSLEYVAEDLWFISVRSGQCLLFELDRFAPTPDGRFTGVLRAPCSLEKTLAD